MDKMKKRFRMPKKINIGDITYEVKKEKKLDTFLGGLFKTTIGMIDYNKKKILLLKRHQKQRNTFFHEVSHGIMGKLGDRYPKAKELNDNETFIDKMGSMLDKTFSSLMKEMK